MSLKVLDPRQPADGEAAQLAPRLASLQGSVIGLLDNAKIGTAQFYAHLERVLRTRFGVREFIRVRKPDATRPAPAEVLGALMGADAIISGIGD